MANAPMRMPAILKQYSDEILSEWMSELGDGLKNDRRISESELMHETREFMTLFEAATGNDESGDIAKAPWEPLREFLEGISHSRAVQGFNADETAAFIFSFKRPLFVRLRKELSKNADVLSEEIWSTIQLIDKLGLLTVKAFQKAREAVISRQQEEMLELSTPVVKLWEGILALPMIGTLDSARTQIVMESLLQRIVDTGSEIAIIDITGVPTVDTLTAQHLLKTVTAIRMMGADCIISGIRPQIAQTIVHLGVDLQGVTTKATLADALALALKRSNFVVSRNKG
jgi:rsbT co-antagonist protein RsbR